MGKCGLNGGKLGALVGLKGNIDYRVCNGHKKILEGSVYSVELKETIPFESGDMVGYLD